jgi:ABC-type glycerol-3-phosphate transport system permease component
MAGDLIVIVPVLIVFFIFQRYITRGVALTGMGGH